MKKRVITCFIALGLAGAMAGCSGGAGGAASAAGGSSGEVVVNMKNTQFERARLEVEAGTTVRWVNQDRVDHSVFEGEPDSGKYLFQSQDYGYGGEFRYTFDKPGTYKIFCNTASHHAIGMKMEVVVK